MTDDTTLVILGATGDLAKRLLLPALGQVLALQPERRLNLIGTGRHDWSERTFRTRVREAFALQGDEDASEGDASQSESARHVASRARYRSLDPSVGSELKDLLAEIEGRVVLYFALPPEITIAAAKRLRPGDVPEGTVFALEKPFGHDEASARELNEVIARLLPEEQIFRVDHFLGESTTLNLLAARLTNRPLDAAWSSEHIDSVAIRYDEALALEGRAAYYDGAGALEDMLQSHLLQLMAFVAMDPPATLSEADLRAATSAVLRATHVWDDNPVRSSRRARYTAGELGGEAVPAYADEEGVDAAQETETLAEASFEVRNARWSGTRFTLRSGKAIGEPETAVVVRFKPVTHLPPGFRGGEEGAVLRFALGPDRMTLSLNVAGGADPFALERADLEADLGEGALRAYTEVLEGILDADPTLSVRADAAEECWRIVQPIIDAWGRGDVPLDEYAAGSQGPDGWERLD